MSSYSWSDLESFIRKEACVSSKKRIKPSMTIEGDLGQHGDDADIFMERFFEVFKVDRGDYKFGRYFLMEGEGILYHIVKKYILRKPHSFTREVLTVKMLEQAIVDGKWESDRLGSIRDK